jgi:hypothetical protein
MSIDIGVAQAVTLLIVAGGLGIALFSCFAGLERRRPGLAGGGVLIGLVLIVSGTLAIGAVGRQYVGTDDGQGVVVTDVSAMAALANASEVYGRGGRGFVEITEMNVYRYLAVHDDGAYSLEELGAGGSEARRGQERGSGVLIHEDATEQNARVEWTRCERDAGSRGRTMWGRWCGDTTITMHVPHGSVIRGFTVSPGAPSQETP